MGVLLGVIGFSVVTYFLILTDSKSPLAGEAAIKYYYLSVLSSVFIAIGIFIIFAKFGTLSFSELNFLFYYFVETCRYDFGITVFLPIFLIITGFLFKLNCFPCHWWSGEVYYGLSYTLLAFFILPVKLCVYALMLKISFTVFSSLSFFWQPYILFSACGSMIFGAFFAANELKIKKFLAYSSINQFGFVLINFVAISVNHAQGVLASFFFVIVYLIVNIVLL
jgi:NADH:ubiquinone oxidoreductase subunit 2 (subunit N)